MVFDPTNPYPRKQLVVLDDDDEQLRGVIAVDPTGLGGAAGGCRFWRYDDDDAASADALILGERTAHKNTLPDLSLGSDKAVLRCPSGPFSREQRFDAFGGAVERLKGQYLIAQEVGTSYCDMQTIVGRTGHVAGHPRLGDRPGGDPSPLTACDVLLSMKLDARRRLDRPISDWATAAKGLGSAGYALTRMHHEEGAPSTKMAADRPAKSVVAAGPDRPSLVA